jgi:hypothetical protein
MKKLKGQERRKFIKNTLALGAAMTMPNLLTGLAAKPRSFAAGPLPWQREMPLREAAKSVVIESVLNPDNPLPGGAMSINNLKMRTTMWGPADRITISLTKNNVWDRRINWYKPPTLEEITEGAFAPINKDYVGIQNNTLRPKNLGWLSKDGGDIDPYRKPIRYPFPCLKPVGQMVLGIDALKGAAAPTLSQNCANGVVSMQVSKGNIKANLEYVLAMAEDVYAIRGDFSGIVTPVWLRLYRHRDTAHLAYMADDNKTYTDPAAEAGKSFNGPIDAPTSGQDGRYFWIRQTFPAEKTFPQGFEYIVMGVITGSGKAELVTEEDKKGLGTAAANKPLRGDWINKPRAPVSEAPGAAATAIFTPGNGKKLEAFVTIVTTMDGTDLPALAKKRLAVVEAEGFEGLVKKNTEWWSKLYDKREDGRIFKGTSGTDCTEDIRALYQQSWADSHGGGTKTDMRKLESSASYVMPEQDIQGWNSGPCYNEIFTTSRFVRNWGDSEDMWKQLIQHWMPGAKEAAKNVFNMPGMFLSHGYLPPIKPDRYVHVTICLELCLGTMAQTVRPAWDEWDYGGDIDFLRDECYPIMKEMALFYAAYAKKGSDGYYHVTPSMQEESWGIYPEFSRNKDVISSLCMFRWGLNRAADAAELLGVDTGLSKQWREVANKITPYPKWQRDEGVVLAEMGGDVPPIRLAEDHFGDAASYPTVLADEINLDSTQDEKDMMVRTVKSMPSGNTNQALLLLGIMPEQHAGRKGGSSRGEASDPETLMNSRSGRIHLFPCVASGAEVAFNKFQARGGFLVSACKNADGVYYVEIQSRRGIQCQLMNPWPGKKVIVRETGKTNAVPVTLDTNNGECLVFATIPGSKYLIEAHG